MENKIKHLEFIQGIITRMNTNSFMIKGWLITLVSALFALAAKDANRMYILIAYIPILPFLIIDGFYLSKERQFRELYIKVAGMNEKDIDFLMDTSQYKGGRNTWIRSIFSITILPFYGSLLIVTLVLMFMIFQ
jgi:hypothetical protein